MYKHRYPADKNYTCLLYTSLRQETMNFNQNLFILVEQFNNQQAQLQIADDADKIAQKMCIRDSFCGPEFIWYGRSSGAYSPT